LLIGQKLEGDKVALARGSEKTAREIRLRMLTKWLSPKACRSRVEIEKMDLNFGWFFLDFKGERYRSYTEFLSPSSRFQLRWTLLIL